MRFLIVDPSAEFRHTLAGQLRERWPDAACEARDPRAAGLPAPAELEGYAAVLLDAGPEGDQGIDWLATLRGHPGAPPVVLIADRGDAHHAIAALKAGAADFLRRSTLDAERLARSLEHALREHETRRLERTGVYQAFSRTRPLDVRRIGAPLDREAVAVAGYRSLRLIGRGGMARVYLAERARDGLQLVLKLLDPALSQDAVFLARFEREQRVLAAIEDEYVARIHGHGVAGGQPYIAMEYLPGGTLAARIHEGMSSLAALRLAAQIARALDAIHARGVVHRDLKPQNIMFRESGRPVIVDFGLARELASQAELTRHGQVLATPRYMSPEQCLGRPADARSDLYSLGVIFHEMLTGRPPFDAEGPAELVYQHVHGEAPRLAARLAGYQGIVDRLLAKRPEDRFQSARALFATIAV